MAAYVLRADRAAIARLPRLALAESALHAPFASFGGVEAYPTLVEQGAVLLQHLVKNHPLPTRTSAPRSCWWRGSSKPTACTGEQWTSRQTQAWLSAPPPETRRSTTSPTGFAGARP